MNYEGGGEGAKNRVFKKKPGFLVGGGCQKFTCLRYFQFVTLDGERMFDAGGAGSVVCGPTRGRRPALSPGGRGHALPTRG